MKKKIAVLASGNGTNFAAIVSALKKKKISRAEVSLLITDKKNAFVRTRAQKYGIPDVFVDREAYSGRENFDRKLIRIIKAEKIDLIVLAGYMRILSPCFVRAFKNKVINIHPALLPSFKGTDAIGRAFRYGAKVTGVTVHFLDEKVDHGPIIAQKALCIKDDESLASVESRIHRIEHKIYPEVIENILSGKLKIKGRNVKVCT